MSTIIVNFVGLRGGGISYAYEMTNGLAVNGVNVIAIVSKNMENYKKWENNNKIKLISINGYTTKFNFIFRLLKLLLFDVAMIKKTLKNYEIDYVYLPMTSYWAPFINGILKKYKKIYTLHDPITHSKKHFISNYISYRNIKSASALIILSDVFRNHVKEKYGFKDENILTIPLGCQDYYIEENSGETLIEYDENQINFLFYGRITEYKGLDILAKAYEKCSEKYRDISLTIVGSGDFSKYKDLYKNLRNVKIFNRWIAETEVASIFKGKNIITIIPYKTATQSGIIPIAMQMESLVLASNCGGIVEQIEDMKTGLLYQSTDYLDLYEKMVYIIGNYKSLSFLINNAKEYITGLSWINLSKKVCEYIDGEK